jgi:hypothetical protein
MVNGIVFVWYLNVLLDAEVFKLRIKLRENLLLSKLYSLPQISQVKVKCKRSYYRKFLMAAALLSG